MNNFSIKFHVKMSFSKYYNFLFAEPSVNLEYNNSAKIYYKF